MLYEMLTGRLPFEADSAVSVAIMQLQKEPVLPRDINDTIPVGLEQITMHAMQKDVSKRYKSAAEMLRDLEEFRRSPDTVFEYTSLRDYTAALNNFYLATPALWEQDFSREGFSWLLPDEADRNAVAYLRRSLDGEELIAVISFSGVDHYDFRLPLPSGGTYDVVFFSGAWSEGYEKFFVAERDKDGDYLMMRLPARTAVFLKKRSGLSLTLGADIAFER